MQIIYKNNQIQEICTNNKTCKKTYGPNMAKKIQIRIQELSCYETIDEMLFYNVGRCHSLSGNRKGQYALDLVQPYRLIFENYLGQLKVVQIIEIVDYH